MPRETNASNSLLTPASAYAGLAGLGGGLLAFILGELLTPQDTGPSADLQAILLHSASWAAIVGVAIGFVILIQDNVQSMRGDWYRDAPVALPVFLILSFMGGAAGQAVFFIISTSLTRGIGWALMGLGIGAGIGLVRGDWVQCQRGAIGGGIGGFVGGFIFDAVGTIVGSFTNDPTGAVSRALGLMIMGAVIGALIRVVQDVMRDAWLLGISTGPYEGKQYALNMKNVSVGAGSNNAVVLNRLSGLPPKLGEFLFEADGWWWRGEVIQINGVPQQNVPLRAGDNLKIGGATFRFQEKSMRQPVSGAPQSWAPPPPIASPHPTVGPGAQSGWGAPAPPPAATVAWNTNPQPPAPTVPVAPPPVATPSLALISPTGATLRRFSGSGTAVVGRVEGNAIMLSNSAISSRHAQFEWNGGKVTLQDLGSTNGTFLNGEKLAPNQPRPVKAGDAIKLGPLELKLQMQN